MENRVVHVMIEGRVQGVYFRESTRRMAEALGLSGYVRNLSDGRVEAFFVGESQTVEKALDFVSTGPPGARVDLVSLHAGDKEEGYRNTRGFSILSTASPPD